MPGGGVLIELFTSNGIGIRSTLGELAAAYGEQVSITDDPIFGPFWEVDVAGAGVLWGTAGAVGDNGMIDSINGGSGCGEQANGGTEIAVAAKAVNLKECLQPEYQTYARQVISNAPSPSPEPVSSKPIPRQAQRRSSSSRLPRSA